MFLILNEKKISKAHEKAEEEMYYVAFMLTGCAHKSLSHWNDTHVQRWL